MAAGCAAAAGVAGGVVGRWAMARVKGRLNTSAINAFFLTIMLAVLKCLSSDEPPVAILEDR